jgi:RND superfamily putative drug exporter
MSLALYRLGHAVGRHRLLVIGTWLALLLVILGAGRMTGSAYQDDFGIPGTESDQGMQVLDDRFGGGASNASAQVLYQVDQGSIQDADAATVVEASLADVADVDGVASVGDPLYNETGDAALVTVQLDAEQPDDPTLDAVLEAGGVDEAGVVSEVGGNAYSEEVSAEGQHAAELVGLLVALGVLLVTFGSFVAAGMPLVTAIVGVGITSGLMALASQAMTISTSAPSFATMLGLAVGIDYALFILSRHRAQLADGVEPRESMARALGTAGGAVVFAGATVVLSLAGLAVVGIPMVTFMGLAGAVAVLLAVLVAVTLFPAVALMFGRRLTPRAVERKPRKRRKPRRASADGGERPGAAQRWVRAVTRFPLVTILAVTGVLGLASVPALSLELALPSPSTEAVGTPARDTNDAVAEAFGPGYGAPLLVTADILASDDPRGTVNDLEQQIRDMPGVGAVTGATPNESGDTALITVIPEGDQTDTATLDLVHHLREAAPGLEDELGVDDILVTGSTAVAIDVNELLTQAIVPFGLTVVGLSFVLLMIVFRSVSVPLKAAFGFVLSVGASMGAIVAVFQWGWLADLVGVTETGPVVSFLPILVMGVLFGLAMDYEMFLVSRMREEFSHTGDATRSVHAGFRHSAPVVTAAALIMVAVFAAFVPGGGATLKPIAFGLAVGVLVDAFLVRMTLVPAMLVLLGRHAWSLPTWLDRLLPVVDVEGEALLRSLVARADVAGPGAIVLRATDLVVRPGAEPMSLTVHAGEVIQIAVPDTSLGGDLALVLTGRGRALRGEVSVSGLVLPEQAEQVRRITALVGPDLPQATTVEQHVRTAVRLLGVRRRDRARFAHRVAEIAGPLTGPIHLLAAGEQVRLAGAVAIAGGARLLVLTSPSTYRTTQDALLAQWFVRHGATVVVPTVTQRISTPVILEETAR